MALLELRGVGKDYGEGAHGACVLDGIDLAVEAGEFIAIVGFSGAGKSTLISTIAGLVAPDRGEALLHGKAIDGPGPDRGVVFQSYSLMPWLSVRGNIALAVDQVFRHESRAERAARVDHHVALVGLAHAANRRPAELSGGMRQRVAVARALATDPDILLLDEPLSALDALTRAKLQDEIEAIWAKDRKTVILVTNDVDEAILLADRIIPLTPGPGATFGPEFRVPFARPRDRGAINTDPAYKALRAEVTGYLMEVGQGRTATSEGTSEPPDLTPVSLFKTPVQLPAAYRAAARSAVERGYVEFYKVKKRFATPGGELTVVDSFDLKVNRGEFVAVIGHSGCGKSTVLSMVAGLSAVSDGGIILDGREVDHAGPDRAVVFQAPSLMPWLSAWQNVALGVDRVYPQASRAERAEIAEYYLMRVGLGDAMDKPAVELSNGMKQRVGIARAFALSPKLLLLDEPFGMLDSLTRWDLQEVLMEVWKRTRVTAMCVTHDVDEAILLADRVVMMTNGPHARIGCVLDIDIPRPRTRQALLAHPRYYEYRQEILDFLAGCDHVATPSPATPATRAA